MYKASASSPKSYRQVNNDLISRYYLKRPLSFGRYGRSIDNGVHNARSVLSVPFFFVTHHINVFLSDFCRVPLLLNFVDKLLLERGHYYLTLARIDSNTWGRGQITHYRWRKRRRRLLFDYREIISATVFFDYFVNRSVANVVIGQSYNCNNQFLVAWNGEYSNRCYF